MPSCTNCQNFNSNYIGKVLSGEERACGQARGREEKSSVSILWFEPKFKVDGCFHSPFLGLLEALLDSISWKFPFFFLPITSW